VINLIDQKTALMFVGKRVGVERESKANNKIIFFRGILKSVSDNDVLIEFKNKLQSFSLESISMIREIDDYE